MLFAQDIAPWLYLSPPGRYKAGLTAEYMRMQQEEEKKSVGGMNKEKKTVGSWGNENT